MQAIRAYYGKNQKKATATLKDACMYVCVCVSSEKKQL